MGLQLAAVGLTFLLVALLVLTSSHAAFVATTQNTGDSVTSAGITLADNDGSTAMFSSASPLSPGTVVDRCVKVTYTGTVDPGAVLLYSAAVTGDAGTYFTLQVDIGAATSDSYPGCGSFASTSTLYTGTIADFSSAHGSYANGVSTWDPSTSGEARTFRFRISVQNDQNAQNRTTNFGFTWETRTA